MLFRGGHIRRILNGKRSQPQPAVHSLLGHITFVYSRDFLSRLGTILARSSELLFTFFCTTAILLFSWICHEFSYAIRDRGPKRLCPLFRQIHSCVYCHYRLPYRPININIYLLVAYWSLQLPPMVLKIIRTTETEAREGNCYYFSVTTKNPRKRWCNFRLLVLFVSR